MDKKENIFSHNTPNDSTGFLLYKVHLHWQRSLKRNLKEIGLTHTQFVILASSHWLNLQNDLVTQIEIAKHAQMDVMMTSNVIRKLEKNKILIRKEHQTDTRAKTVELTEYGFQILKKSLIIVEDFDRKYFNSLKDTANFNKELLRLLS